MKKYAYIIVGVTTVLLTIALCYQYSLSKKYIDNYSRSEANFKAAQQTIDSVTMDNRAYQLTISELNYSRDSVIKKLQEVQKEHKIKDKNLISMSYLESTASKADTIKLPGDTVFRDRSVCVDTILSSRWYKLNINMEYPSTLIVNPSFVSEKYIIASYKKETIAPPKKCWLLRLFQKKHKVISVEVVEKNPFIKSKNNKFIQVVK